MFRRAPSTCAHASLERNHRKAKATQRIQIPRWLGGKGPEAIDDQAKKNITLSDRSQNDAKKNQIEEIDNYIFRKKCNQSRNRLGTVHWCVILTERLFY